MRLYKHLKRGHPTYNDSPWWCDFSIDGKRFRLPLDTVNKPDARKRANAKHADALAGKLSANSASFARLTFLEGADRYLAGRQPELQPSSYIKEKQLLVRPRTFFGITRLNQISAEQILSYREQRGKECGPSLINMEIGVIRRILKRAKAWAAIADDVRPLKEPETIGRALSPEEKRALLETARSKPEWETAYFGAIIALNTTMRGCEIRALRWCDVDLLDSTLTIRKSKTVAGQRVIPLTRDAFDIFVKLRERAESCGSVSPDHFIFAAYKPVGVFREKEVVGHKLHGFDPTAPMRSWKKAWRALTAKAGLKGLRFHDLRHHAITELCESGASESTIKAIAGHVSDRMLERYAHVRLHARRQAIEALSTSEPPLTAPEVMSARGYSRTRGS